MRRLKSSSKTWKTWLVSLSLLLVPQLGWAQQVVCLAPEDARALRAKAEGYHELRTATIELEKESSLCRATVENQKGQIKALRRPEAAPDPWLVPKLVGAFVVTTAFGVLLGKLL